MDGAGKQQEQKLGTIMVSHVDDDQLYNQFNRFLQADNKLKKNNLNPNYFDAGNNFNY